MMFSDCLLYCSLFTTYYYFTTRLIAKNLTVKQKSWVLSFALTVLLSIESVLLFKELFTRNTFALVFSSSLKGIYACNLFRAFCVCDLIIGSAEYPKVLNILEGWVHHVYYIVQLTIFLCYDIPNCFWIFCFCEIPTLLMALIQLFNIPISRQAYIVTFIFFRVLLFAYVLLFFHIDAPWNIFVYTIPFSSLALGLHIWWSYLLLQKLILLL